MDLRLTVHLPRDLDKMNTLRHVLDGALQTLGVADSVRADVGLIVNETWTNVVAHLTVGGHFEVIATVDDDTCVIEVTDPGDVTPEVSNVLTEAGHGLRIVSSLADTVKVHTDGHLLRVTRSLTAVDR